MEATMPQVRRLLFALTILLGVASVLLPAPALAADAPDEVRLDLHAMLHPAALPLQQSESDGPQAPPAVIGVVELAVGLAIAVPSVWGLVRVAQWRASECRVTERSYCLDSIGVPALQGILIPVLAVTTIAGVLFVVAGIRTLATGESMAAQLRRVRQRLHRLGPGSGVPLLEVRF